MADTNILISTLIYPCSKPSQALFHAANYHKLLLSDYNIAELRRVAATKFPEKLADVEIILTNLTYELVYAPRSPNKLIADPKDVPILNAALLHEVDIIVSGDKHFRQLDMEYPQVLTAAAYLAMVEEEEDQIVHKP
ncbi:MAG: PIN domain-containing protein [Oscillospiraceae bacterium]|nr:PIN domain-containing protein [Oscillospiraceae bacterium]